MSHPIVLVAELTIREAARRRIFLAIILLGLLYVALFGLGFAFLIQEVTREETARPRQKRHRRPQCWCRRS